jgi:hypothetical protein
MLGIDQQYRYSIVVLHDTNWAWLGPRSQDRSSKGHARITQHPPVFEKKENSEFHRQLLVSK